MAGLLNMSPVLLQLGCHRCGASFAGPGESWHVSSKSWDRCTFLSSRDAHRRTVSAQHVSSGVSSGQTSLRMTCCSRGTGSSRDARPCGFACVS
jgi:hypothetical protein